MHRNLRLIVARVEQKSQDHLADGIGVEDCTGASKQQKSVVQETNSRKLIGSKHCPALPSAPIYGRVNPAVIDKHSVDIGVRTSHGNVKPAAVSDALKQVSNARYAPGPCSPIRRCEDSAAVTNR